MHGPDSSSPGRFVIGLTGGVGSGKTHVAAELQRLGAAVLDADSAAHEVLATSEVRSAVCARWGRQVLDAAGGVDRRAVAGIVFAPPPDGPRELEWLEQLTHPRIAARFESALARASDEGHRVAVLDAAVLLKAGWDRMCDHLIFVDAPPEVRLARCRRRGWSAEELSRREAAQMPLAAKRARAGTVIDNSGSPGETRCQVQKFWYNMVPVS